jgi:type I restriction enzyme S subunit
VSKWEMVRLGDVATYVNGFAFKPADWSNKGIPIIRIQNLTGTSDVVNYYDKKYSTKYEINNGDVLISWSASLGVYEWKKGKALLNQHIFKVVFDKLVLDKRFFVFVIAEKLREMSSLVHGSTMKHITKKYFDRIEIQLPPLESQKKIATALDSANALIEKRKEQIEKLDLLIKSQFIEMFGDPVTNPKGWSVNSLAQHLKVIGGYMFKSTGYTMTGIPVLRIGNINTGTLTLNDLVYWTYTESLERYFIYPGDLVMSLTGTVGKDDYANVCVLPAFFDRYYLNQRNAKLNIFGDLSNMYLLYLLRNKEIKKKLTGISRGIRQANISNSDILSLNVPIPPLSLQNQFAEFVEKVEAQKALLQKSLADMEQNYQSLLQKCFKGEIF